MFIAILELFIIIALFIVWFNIPYSPVKTDFRRDIGALISQNELHTYNEVFTEEYFNHLPVCIQKYIQNCGYIGKPNIQSMYTMLHL